MTAIPVAVRTIAQKFPHEDPIKVARRTLKGLAVGDMIAILADAIANQQRQITQGVEREAFTRAHFDRSEAPTVDGTFSSCVRFRQLEGSKFALGSNVAVEWLTATVEDHEARIAFLSKLRSGLDRTIAHHREAIELINASGGTCLADVLEAK